MSSSSAHFIKIGKTISDPVPAEKIPLLWKAGKLPEHTAVSVDKACWVNIPANIGLWKASRLAKDPKIIRPHGATASPRKSISPEIPNSLGGSTHRPGMPGEDFPCPNEEVVEYGQGLLQCRMLPVGRPIGSNRSLVARKENHRQTRGHRTQYNGNTKAWAGATTTPHQKIRSA